MSKTPDFHRIVATITDRDIDKFYLSVVPDDSKQQVREAPDHETKKRFVAGYLIRTKQINPERLNPEGKKPSTKKAIAKKRASGKANGS